jgi:hypothetical protein
MSNHDGKLKKLAELQAYSLNELTFIPMREKKLVSEWDWVGAYQNKLPSMKNIQNWAERFDYFALLTGPKIVGLDIEGDDPGGKFFVCSYDWTTACCTTPRNGLHLLYKVAEPIPTQTIIGQINGEPFRIELIGAGGKCWINMPPSPGYGWTHGLDALAPFPLSVFQPYLALQPQTLLLNRFPYHGLDCLCIGAILDRDLLLDKERNYGLFTLGALLLRNRNDLSYARTIVTAKNNSISQPLKQQELSNILQSLEKNRWTNFGCRAVLSRLPWMAEICQNCSFHYGKKQVNKKLLYKALSAVSPSGFKVFMYVKTFTPTLPYNVTNIADETNLTRGTVRKSLKELRTKGFIIPDPPLQSSGKSFTTTFQSESHEEGKSE